MHGHRPDFRRATIGGLIGIWISCSCGWTGSVIGDCDDDDTRAEALRDHAAHLEFEEHLVGLSGVDDETRRDPYTGVLVGDR